MTTATLRLSTPLTPAKAGSETASKVAPSRNSLLVRFYNALMEARMRAAMREIARHPHVRRLDIKPLDVVPQDEVKRAGYQATYADAGLLPFVRGA